MTTATNLLRIITSVAVAAIVCSCGASAAGGTASTENAFNIETQCDPLVIEIDSFEGRTFSGERSFIAIYEDRIWGKIPTVAGMVRTGMMTSTLALTFNKCDARVSEPRISKKGDNYYFTVYAQDGKFFGRTLRNDCRISITVRFDGYVDIDISSDSITKVRSTSWSFAGHVNKERTEAAKLYKGSEPEFL